MKTIKSQDNTKSLLSNDWVFCIISIWIAVFYSVIIQYKYIQIPNGMLIFGVLILVSFILSCMRKKFSIKSIFSRECLWMLAFMAYMLPVGIITSPFPRNHITQWITSLEYMFMTIVISSIINDSGTDTFHVMLLVVSFVVGVIFLKAPVLYVEGGRYSISKEVNPNGLGVTFTTGIWVILNFQQKKKIPVLIPIAVVAFYLYCIFTTGSRKALIAAGIIIILWYMFGYLPRIFKENNKWKGVILFFSILLSLVLIKEFLNFYSGSDIEARMGGLDNEVTSGLRSTMYKNGWRLFLSNPLFGLGFQGYKAYYGTYSHATLVEIPVSAGIAGTILYYVAYFISIKKCITLYRYCIKKEAFSIYASEIKMTIILWAAMIFYCSCIIHPYQFESYLLFGILYGQSAYIEKKIQLQKDDSQSIEQQLRKKQCRYIK